jgi:hypothetical protein
MHGQDQFFLSWLPRRLNIKKLFQPCFELPKFMPGTLDMVENNFFCSGHPTIDFENRRMRAKKFAWAML